MSQASKTLHEFGSVAVNFGSSTTVSGTGALGNLAAGPNQVVLVTTTGAASATLGATSVGTVRTIVLVVDGGDLVINGPTGVVGASTSLTWAEAGDSITLVYTTVGWVIVANSGVALV